ncbi:MAG TPA: glutamine--tRNA ligase/YqeY domain fusion protein [Pirellulaceae bacterium]|nr:glutamine--tRNA ligase/YqeY domain fusion protein [Pirellulaceae bacterium]HMO91375.1 glutamine--tRNA ligase/YqeY domain fusion protein [Pirellulaceae bacterium]HMP69600.1 glutamine--tRNA ligase/YqeY domain fusion protein [Pirellulaceae bacterium]
MNENKTESVDFVRQIINEDQASGKHAGRVHTRFPPEPNGYLHIGHAKSICVNFGIAREFGGKCNLRFDDTNPTAEDQEFVDSIQADVRWLGFDWEDRLFFASDYFERLYEYALQLIQQGDAYVCSLPADKVSEFRGRWDEPGRASPDRDRPIAENLELFQRMKAGEFPDGTYTLRAKIDMNSSNMNLRDPAMYRIRHAHHHRTGDQWCIYPTYDWAHGQSDSLEGITHSLCTLEFEHHRPLYEWFIEKLGIFPSRQIEFAKLNLTYTILSKRNLRFLVEQGYVDGWDDPRMPTLRGMRRRGYTPESIRNFCDGLGLTKFNSTSEMVVLERSVREHLNSVALRRMAVLDPLKVVIENFAEQQHELRTCINNPEDATAGTREVPFSREIYIEREDFMENPPKDFFRLAPGREVRLRYAYFLKCESVVKDAAGNIVELRCSYDPETAGGQAPDGRKVKGTIHWVPANEAIEAEIRLYDALVTAEFPSRIEEGKNWLDYLNPHSLHIVTNAKLEPALAEAQIGQAFQFERLGYFCVDSVEKENGRLVFNRTVSLKDKKGG